MSQDPEKILDYSLKFLIVFMPSSGDPAIYVESGIPEFDPSSGRREENLAEVQEHYIFSVSCPVKILE